MGVFRASSEEILIQYGDGSTEIVRPNSEVRNHDRDEFAQVRDLLHGVVSRRPRVQLGRPQDGIAPICEPPGFGRFDREGGRDTGTIGLRERSPLSNRSVIDDIGTGSLTGSRGCAGTGGRRATGGRPGHGHARCRREGCVGAHARCRVPARRWCSPASPQRAQPSRRKRLTCRLQPLIAEVPVTAKVTESLQQSRGDGSHGETGREASRTQRLADAQSRRKQSREPCPTRNRSRSATRKSTWSIRWSQSRHQSLRRRSRPRPAKARHRA